MPDDISATVHAPISEAASENRPKRGRPRVTPPEWDTFAFWPTICPGKSRRSKVDAFNALQARRVLEGDERFRYLTDPNREYRGILAELGRLDSPAKVRAAAGPICEHRMKTKAAIAMIRGWRLKSTEGNALALAHAIDGAIDAYTARYPGTTREQVCTALNFVRQDYEPDEGDEGSGGDEEDE